MIVYLAVNRCTGLKYVGATKSTLEKRKFGHGYRSKKENKRFGTRFSVAIDEYGLGSFDWSVLSVCSSPEEMFAEERRWIRELNTQDILFGYNMAPGGKGWPPMTDETKKKLSIAAQARRRGPHSEETRRKMSEAGRGKSRSEEHCRNISLAKKGQPLPPFSDQHRERLSVAGRGVSKSEEHRRKLSEAIKALWLAKKSVSEARL